MGKVIIQEGGVKSPLGELLALCIQSRSFKLAFFFLQTVGEQQR
jgi:hypothetical protein